MNKKKIENYFNENKATAWLWKIPGICLVIIGLDMIIFVENGMISGQIFLIPGVIWLVSSIARTKGKEVYDFTEKNVSEESEVLKKDIEKKLADYGIDYSSNKVSRYSYKQYCFKPSEKPRKIGDNKYVSLSAMICDVAIHKEKEALAVGQSQICFLDEKRDRVVEFINFKDLVSLEKEQVHYHEKNISKKQIYVKLFSKQNEFIMLLPDDYDSELFIQKLEECFVKGDKCE